MSGSEQVSGTQPIPIPLCFWAFFWNPKLLKLNNKAYCQNVRARSRWFLESNDFYFLWYLSPVPLPVKASGVFVGMNTTPRSDQRMTMGNDGASNGGLIACALPVICGIPTPSLWGRTIRTNLSRCWIARPCLMGRFTRAGAPLRIT